jgi:endonuclease-3
MTEENREFIYEYLLGLFPDAQCELKHKNAYELLVSVILSAQSTDKRINIITPNLFLKYPTPKDLSEAKQEELEQVIFSAGFYRNKAKNLISCASSIVNKFNSNVPNNLKDLQTLAGVGRKTANVVYSVAYGGQAIAVDTHVFRVSNRLGLVDSKKELEVELGLMEQFEESTWTRLHYVLVLFGRYYCKAKKPACKECGLKHICKYYKKEVKSKEV